MSEAKIRTSEEKNCLKRYLSEERIMTEKND